MIPHISDIVWYLSSYTVNCSYIFWLKIASLWWDSPWATYAGEKMLFHVGNSGELFLLGAVLTGENCVNCWFGAIRKTSVGDYVLRCSLFSIFLLQALIMSCFRVSACMLSHFWLFATLWTEPTRQEYWSGLTCPPSGYLSDPTIKPTSLKSLALAGGFFTTSATWEASKSQ